MELRDVRSLYLACRRRFLVEARPLRAEIVGALLVAALAAITFLVGLDQPAGAIWDESYYLTAAQRYRDHTAQFASHPPLGLMLIAAGDALAEPHRTAADRAALARDKHIAGEAIPAGFQFSSMRVASGAFAVVGAVLFFVLMRLLAGSLVPALLLSNLYLFDNALIAHFRAAHLDAFQMAFLLGALVCFVVSERRRARSSLGLEFWMSALVGLALMVKVNVAPFVLLPLMLVARRLWLWRDLYTPSQQRLMAARDLAVSAAGGVLACAAVLTVHVAISSRLPEFGTPAGDKDARFISSTYDQYLRGQRPLSPAVVLDAGRDYATFMATDYEGMARSDPNGSHPLQWPFNSRAITYRWDPDGTRTAYLALTGNPVGWVLGLVALVVATILLVLPARVAGAALVSSSLRKNQLPLIGMLLLLYVTFMGVHVYLDAHRVLYLYHYFPALLLSFCLVPLVLEELAHRWPRFRRHQHTVLASSMGLALIAFLFLAPLTFHRPLTPAEHDARMSIVR